MNKITNLLLPIYRNNTVILKLKSQLDFQLSRIENSLPVLIPTNYNGLWMHGRCKWKKSHQTDYELAFMCTLDAFFRKMVHKEKLQLFSRTYINSLSLMYKGLCINYFL